jgi:hypothetical protein
MEPTDGDAPPLLGPMPLPPPDEGLSGFGDMSMDELDKKDRKGGNQRERSVACVS